MSLLNFAGLTDGQHAEKRIGPLSSIFQRVCATKGMRSWEEDYGTLDHGLYHDGLRRLLFDIGVPVWAEITTGYSMREYRCLDAYVKVFGRSLIAPAQEAHFVLGMNIPVSERKTMPRPEDWWNFQVWQSYGQGDSISEYQLEDVRVPWYKIGTYRGPRPRKSRL